MVFPDETAITNQFGLRVRNLRVSRGLSQEAFADLAGLDRSYLGGVERGDRNVSLNNIQKIASALEMTLADLFKDISDTSI